MTHDESRHLTIMSEDGFMLRRGQALINCTRVGATRTKASYTAFSDPIQHVSSPETIEVRIMPSSSCIIESSTYMVLFATLRDSMSVLIHVDRRRTVGTTVLAFNVASPATGLRWYIVAIA